MKNWILFACLVLACSLSWAQPIYKVVDENGNVTYTDQKPSEDAEPMDLPELNVLEISTPNASQRPLQNAPETEPLRLDIVSPEHDANIHGTGNRLDVALSSNIEIPATTLIVFFLDDVAQEPVQSLNYTFDFIPRGTHTLKAQLQTGAGRVLAESDTVTFHMHQASRLNPPGP